MNKYYTKKLTNKVGLPPGAIVYSGDEKQPTTVMYYSYDDKVFEQIEVKNILDIKLDDSKVNWINISGFDNNDLIMNIIESVEIHTLLAEDIFNMEHFPKFEEHENSILFILKNYFIKNDLIQQNHCSVFLKDNLVISFQEHSNDILDKKVERISLAKGKARYKKADYLFFVLLDAFIDSYYTIFEEIREELNILENSLIKNKKQNRINEIYALNKKLNYVRKGIQPLREAIKTLIDDEVGVIEEANFIYFRDAYDHVNDLMQLYESFGGIIKGLIDLNESNLNSSTNEVMKVLTIIATIFIPLTFIAGVYGMNFENMPELQYKHGYFVVWAVMIVVLILMVSYFRRKKWL